MGAPATKEGGKNVTKVGETFAAKTLLRTAVVLLALRRVAQHVVGMGH